MNFQYFKTSIGYLANLFNAKLTADQVLAFWNYFKLWDKSKFDMAIKNIVINFVPTSTVPFPVPAIWEKYTGGSVEDDSEIALVELIEKIDKVGAYSDIKFDNPIITHTVLALGGWIEVCSWTFDMWRFRSKEFKSIYSALKKRGEFENETLQGRISLENDTKLKPVKTEQRMVGDIIKKIGVMNEQN